MNAIRTHAEVAQELAERGICRISKQRVWQIEQRALQKLRERLAALVRDDERDQT